MATPTSAQSSMGTIEQFIRQLGGGQTKQAEAGTEPGSIGGATSHPVKNVDDRTEPAKEGARSKENATDVKEDQGKPSVESAPDATAKSAKDLLAGFAKRAEGGAVMTPGSAADDHLQIGTNVQATGDDKSNETSSAKAGKEDPGSSHPARTDNEALDGHKYAGDDGLKKIAADMEAIAGRICNQIVAGTQQPTKQAAAQPARGGAVAPQTAFQAGWEAAGLPRDKRAADAMVHQTFCEIIKTAGDDADNVIEYLDAFFGKQAEGEIPPVDPSQMAGGPVDPMGGGGGGDPMGGGGGDEMGGMGGGGGGELMDALGGGEPAGGMGGMEGGGGPGGPGGGEGGVEDVLALMDQLGVTPEDILAAAEEGGAGAEGGGGGGGDPLAGAGGGGGGGGGEPPPEKAGSDRGKGKPVALPPGFTKAAMKTYLEELVSRSRAKK